MEHSIEISAAPRTSTRITGHSRLELLTSRGSTVPDCVVASSDGPDIISAWRMFAVFIVGHCRSPLRLALARVVSAALRSVQKCHLFRTAWQICRYKPPSVSLRCRHKLDQSQSRGLCARL